jgi:amino acid transporter
MDGKQAYYLAELVKIVFGLLPIALVLFAMIFLRRHERTSQTLWLQSLSALWLILAGISRLVLSTVVGISLLPQKIFHDQAEVQHRMDFYFTVSSLLHFAELAAFTLFAVALVIYFHQRLPKRAHAPNQALEPTASRSDV